MFNGLSLLTGHSRPDDPQGTHLHPEPADGPLLPGLHGARHRPPLPQGPPDVRRRGQELDVEVRHARRNAAKTKDLSEQLSLVQI